jgi:flagellar biosynthetic protein FlhB
MKMTRREIEEERRLTGANPELKAERRRVHARIAHASRLEDTSVVVAALNPPLAIALGYDASRDVAPRVVASSRGPAALELIEWALRQGVDVQRRADLARSLATLDAGETIARRHYDEVAALLIAARQDDEQATDPTTSPDRTSS